MNFMDIDDAFSNEIIRGGEVYLDGMLRVATSADQRASSLAGMFIAAATALLAAVTALATPTPVSKLSLIVGGVVTSLMFLAAAIICLHTVMPVKFYLPGCEPEAWETDVAAKRKLKECLGERAVHIQNAIVKNAAVIETNAKYFRWGARLGIAAPFFGMIAWLLASACRFA